MISNVSFTPVRDKNSLYFFYTVRKFLVKEYTLRYDGYYRSIKKEEHEDVALMFHLLNSTGLVQDTVSAKLVNNSPS